MSAFLRFGGIFDYETKQRDLKEVTRTLENPDVWRDADKAQMLGKEKTLLERVVLRIDTLSALSEEVDLLIELMAEVKDASLWEEAKDKLRDLMRQLDEMEFQRMFSLEQDSNSAFIDVQAGSGGTEAQDWANMLLRMYLRFAEKKGFKATLLEVSPGDVAGIKSATIQVDGAYAYGWLRTETGVHRLVRKSPFDSGNRRHTSFASIFVSPEIEDDIDIDINPADLRVDTYRASGAGGQHVNKTDSAIRITHEPTGVVVQCQNQRSQHKNRAQAMKQLRARLYALERQKKDAAQAVLEAGKASIGWGSQIRSYVLDDSRIKDLRTGHENRNTQSVLDGDLQAFIEESLKAAL